MKRAGWLPSVLWPIGVVAVVAGFVLLFEGDGEPTLTAIVGRAVGGSFIACGLITWQHRKDSRSGPLMTAIGFLFVTTALLSEIGSPLGDTLAVLIANGWVVPFSILVLGFPSGRLRSWIDRLIVWGLFVVAVVFQLIWLLFLPFPEGTENVLLVTADTEIADAIDTFQRASSASLALLIAGVLLWRWRAAAPPLRRLLLPTLAGAIAVLVLGVQGIYRVVTGEFMRPSEEVTAFVLLLVPLAFLFGMLRAQLARAGMADLIVTLQRAPDARRLGEQMSKALGDPSLELVHWLPGFECYVDTAGTPVLLPAESSGRAATRIDHDGVPVAALIHDPALSYEPELLEVVCAAADVALERERLQSELESRVEELAGSRARIVEAGDAARRRIERDLHDGAQQRLVGLAIALRLTENRIRDDPEAAAGLVAAAREEVSESLKELRELARGIHPAVLEHGLPAALDSLATRSRTPVSVSVELDGRLPSAVELAAYFVASEALANVGKYAEASRATIRAWSTDGGMAIEVEDDGIGGADAAQGSGLRGLEDRVQAVGGRLRIVSPAGGGTVMTAEIPCQTLHAAPAANPSAAP